MFHSLSHWLRRRSKSRSSSSMVRNSRRRMRSEVLEDRRMLAGVVSSASFGGHDYLLLSQDNWVNSEAVAQTLNSHLVTVNDAAENAFVYNTFSVNQTINRSFWIGLNDTASEGNFQWASGAPASYFNWNIATGEPNNSGGNEDHVLMYGAAPFGGLWNDFNGAVNTINGGPLMGVVEIESPNVTVNRFFRNVGE